jgi:hypothetical protein
VWNLLSVPGGKDRHDDAYAEVARVTGDEAFLATQPFEVEVIPSRLVAKLRPS